MNIVSKKNAQKASESCSKDFFLSVQTPRGQLLPSSGYQDGTFRLRLANPVRGGRYQCSVPDTDQACTHGNNVTATVTVDAVVYYRVSNPTMVS